VTASDREMISKYRVFSLTYDNLFYGLERLVFLNEKMDPRAALVRRVPDNNLRVLDVCCGTGRDSIALANSGNRVTGIDMSPDMLALAKKKIRKLGVQSVSFLRMKATEIGFHDEAFDVIVSSFALHEMDYDAMMAALKEMYRLLKKDGRLYLVDYGREESVVLQWMFSAYLKVCYPKRVLEFLDYDWSRILAGIGFHLDAIDKCRVSRLMSARKSSAL
jgi:demethylmenaquinone methyltransferase/2-methoxy-6-polyprenyl-1,4-benzoquinol methylase